MPEPLETSKHAEYYTLFIHLFYLQEGCYDIVRDENGCIKSIIVIERGITLFGSTFSRRYRYRYKGKQAEFTGHSIKGKERSEPIVTEVEKDDGDSSNGTWQRALGKSRRLSRVLMGFS